MLFAFDVRKSPSIAEAKDLKEGTPAIDEAESVDEVLTGVGLVEIDSELELADVPIKNLIVNVAIVRRRPRELVPCVKASDDDGVVKRTSGDRIDRLIDGQVVEIDCAGIASGASAESGQ